jgi:hypothetical protein
MTERNAELAKGFTMTLVEQTQTLLQNVGQLVYQGYCLPGQYALSIFLGGAPPAPGLVGPPIVAGDQLTALVAGAIWLCAILLAVKVCRVMRDLYITARGYTRRINHRWQRIFRNAACRSMIASKAAGRGRTGVRVEPTLFREVDLGELEDAVLRCHGELGPGGTLTAFDAADALGVSVGQTRKVFQTLTMLQLTDVASRSRPGEDAYRLTPYGESFLAACSRRSSEYLEPRGLRVETEFRSLIY